MRLLLLTGWSVLSYCIPTSAPDLPLPKPITLLSVSQMIVREAVANGVPPRLAFWLAMSESGLNPIAARHEVNGTWSLGIMQLSTGSFSAAAWMTPEENVAAGLAYFGKLYKKCGKRPACAVRAYRSGKVQP